MIEFYLFLSIILEMVPHAGIAVVIKIYYAILGALQVLFLACK